MGGRSENYRGLVEQVPRGEGTREKSGTGGRGELGLGLDHESSYHLWDPCYVSDAMLGADSKVFST